MVPFTNRIVVIFETIVVAYKDKWKRSPYKIFISWIFCLKTLFTIVNQNVFAVLIEFITGFTYPFEVHFVEMVLKELDTSRQIGRIEFVRNVPTKRSELSTFLYHCMKKRSGVQHGFPLWEIDNVQLVLWYDVIIM